MSRTNIKPFPQSATIIIIIIVASLYVFDVHTLIHRIMYHSPRILTCSIPGRPIAVNQREPCTVILRERSGRLGNRLFMFASALGLTLTHSCYLNISEEIVDELTRTFDLDLRPESIRSAHHRSGAVQKIYNHCSYISHLFQAHTSRIVELTGFWQVHTYFSNHSDEIRRQLRFKTAILNRVNNFLGNIANGSLCTRVGVHIRRADFLQDRTVSSDRFVFDAMSYFMRKFRATCFIVATDDRPYCERAFGREPNVHFTPASFDATEDLAMLTRCDHVIITAGTFGWWGSLSSQEQNGRSVGGREIRFDADRCELSKPSIFSALVLFLE